MRRRRSRVLLFLLLRLSPLHQKIADPHRKFPARPSETFDRSLFPIDNSEKRSACVPDTGRPRNVADAQSRLYRLPRCNQTDHDGLQWHRRPIPPSALQCRLRRRDGIFPAEIERVQRYAGRFPGAPEVPVRKHPDIPDRPASFCHRAVFRKAPPFASAQRLPALALHSRRRRRNVPAQFGRFFCRPGKFEYAR